MSHNPNHESYNSYLWSGFAVVFGTNFVGALVVLMRRDIVWCVAATWICVSIWMQRPKPVPIYVRAFSVKISSYWNIYLTLLRLRRYFSRFCIHSFWSPHMRSPYFVEMGKLRCRVMTMSVLARVKYSQKNGQGHREIAAAPFGSRTTITNIKFEV